MHSWDLYIGEDNWKGREREKENETTKLTICCCLVTKSCLILCDLWTIAFQAPLSLGFPRQDYWSGLPFPSPGHLPDPGIIPASPALAGGVFTTEPPGKPKYTIEIHKYKVNLILAESTKCEINRIKSRWGTVIKQYDKAL